MFIDVTNSFLGDNYVNIKFSANDTIISLENIGVLDAWELLLDLSVDLNVCIGKVHQKIAESDLEKK